MDATVEVGSVHSLEHPADPAVGCSQRDSSPRDPGPNLEHGPRERPLPASASPDGSLDLQRQASTKRVPRELAAETADTAEASACTRDRWLGASPGSSPGRLTLDVGDDGLKDVQSDFLALSPSPASQCDQTPVRGELTTSTR